VVHVLDLAATGNLASGNAPQIVSGLVKPALLIWLLASLRRAERQEPQTIVVRSWMIPVRQGSVVAVAVAVWALPLGLATKQMVTVPLTGCVLAAAAFWWIVSRAPSHRVAGEHKPPI
jgi:hypothetical protein